MRLMTSKKQTIIPNTLCLGGDRSKNSEGHVQNQRLWDEYDRCTRYVTKMINVRSDGTSLKCRGSVYHDIKG
jgi:hypothetical protein